MSTTHVSRWRDARILGGVGQNYDTAGLLGCARPAESDAVLMEKDILERPESVLFSDP